MKHAVFVKNAAVLTGTSCILRTIGIFFRMYLSGVIGAEGMGLYQLIISIYVLASTFATSGISTAVTRMIADELVCGTPATVRHVLRRSVTLSVLLGIASAALVYAG
ncbi:MAG: oligosaccharide flippase family protein, partial [Clostridia bacterium]|nr:oligosaccharide flippase family protein [Clostridia bacterium]